MTLKWQQKLSELTLEVNAYFESLSYSAATMKKYRMGWAVIAEFMEENSIEFYGSRVGDSFIDHVLGASTYEDLSRREKHLIRCVNVLTEYQSTGIIKFRSITKTYDFEGGIGQLMINFFHYRKSQGMTEDTINSNKLYLHRFLEYLEVNKVFSILDMGKQHIMNFINGLAFYSKATIHCMLSSLRNFLKYLRDNQLVSTDFSYLLPKSNYKKEAKLPTTYTKDEVEKLIRAVDRSSPKGKRDIAMILLAARLGLRASDICGLKFENIRWETNTLELIQKKTKEKIELPLLIEIGNAIIDYLKYGRPVSDHPYIFLRAGQPYDRLEEPTLHSIVSHYLKLAGINDISKKKHGPHALRHSLAGILLEKKTPLPVISEVLGHTNTESTKSYLRIDLESLRQCALEVPSLHVTSYQGVV